MQERIFAAAGFADQGVLVLLVVLALTSLGLIFNRWQALRGIHSQSVKLRSTITEAVRHRDLSVVHQIAKDEGSIEGRLVSLAINQVQSGKSGGIVELFSSIGQIEKAQMERSLGFLATVGSNAPYIGLFGTVLGIMKAFHDMSRVANASQQVVMSGISSALIATAAGLLVAIPAVLAFNYFNRQIKSIMGSIDACRDLVLAWVESEGGDHGRANLESR